MPESDSRRGRRDRGVPVIPSRVWQARNERGLSLADVAGTEVTRSFIHQVEHGKARPSYRVLQLIAERTGKPVEYFIDAFEPESRGDLPAELIATARRIRRSVVATEMSKAEQEAVRALIANLHSGARLLRALEGTQT